MRQGSGMPHPREPLPPELMAAFAVSSARAFGISRRRLDRADLERVFRGARLRADADDEADADQEETPWSQRAAQSDRLLRAYRPIMPSHAFLCGPTAALEWGIPIPMRLGSRLHVGVFRPRTAPVRAEVSGHQFTRGFIKVVDKDGVAITDPASTWASLGGLLTEDELVAAADRVLRVPRHPGGFRAVTESALATREELALLCERKGRPGAPALRRALDAARTGSSSPPETQIRLILRDARLPEPALDVDVYDQFGRFLGCSELAYPELRIAIEYESDGHLVRAQLERDIDKYQAYAEAGWTVVRVTSQHVFKDSGETVRRVRQARAGASAR